MDSAAEGSRHMKTSESPQERRAELRARAEVLRRLSEDDELWHEVSSAFERVDGERFRRALETISPQESWSDELRLWICGQFEGTAPPPRIWACNWTGTGAPFDAAAERAKLESRLGTALTDDQFRGFIEWLWEQGFIDCGFRGPEPGHAEPSGKNVGRCNELSFGGPPPLPGPPGGE